MDLLTHQILLLVSICAVVAFYGAALIYYAYYLPLQKKRFLMREMAASLRSRTDIYGEELIGHCENILQNIKTHCTMRDGFKMVYTYGAWDIGVNWYPVNGLFEFTIPSTYKTIAKIHFPT